MITIPFTADPTTLTFDRDTCETSITAKVRLDPNSPAVMSVRILTLGRIEIAPGIYRRISPVTGELETLITPEGLAHLRRKQRSRGLIQEAGKSMERSFDEAARLLDQAFRKLFPVGWWYGDAKASRANVRAEVLRPLQRRCAGHVRRQGRVRR